MSTLIARNQSAFIKKRSLHDNFMYVRNMARRYNQTRTSMLIFRLDIAKAFDTIRWDYLLELLTQRVFPWRWRN
jgi:retron-type reverse transcriptase